MTVLKKIEKLLGIKLEEQRFGKNYDSDQKNHYSGTEEHIDRLQLDDVVIKDLSALFVYTGDLSALTINNSTIPNFSDLLAFNAYYMTLDGVTLKGNDCKTKGKVPGHLKLLNMNLDAKALRCFEKSKIGGFRQVEFRNCHIDNIQSINSIQQISYLILDKITFTYKPLKNETKSGVYRISVYNSKLDHVSFLPFKKSLSHIEFGSCKIGSLSGLEEFPKLGGISISTDTRVKDKTILKNKNGRNINCNIYKAKRPFDLEQIMPIKKYITRLDLVSFTGDVVPHLKKLKRVSHLTFGGGKVNIAAFLPIAQQIKSIAINRGIFFNHECFDQFKKLTSFKLSNFSNKKKGLQSYERILPLKNQLKELEIYDVKRIKDAHLLEKFKVLESLKLNDMPVKDAQHVLQLQSLKKLLLSVDYKKKVVLNLKKLTKLEYLRLETDMRFKGFEHLHRLKSLQLGSDFSEPDIDISALPKMEQLERLNITNYNQRIKDLSQFPNLKYLRIKGCQKLKLKTMKKLEVLDLDNSAINDFSKFEKQPRLKRLDLSAQFNDINLKGLDKFPNLRMLDLMETYIKDISALKSLKKLEYLDLYSTDVSDVSVINTLLKMKEVNLATSSKVDLESQLDRPEIAVYVGLPTMWLSVWEKDEFGV
ncbi:MAG: Leucine-rich repeat (LRR) protein [Crocinitomix sp.]|jgi:Leucine-rich repeat (LRR) protein